MKLLSGGADLILKTQNLSTNIGVKLLLGGSHVIEYTKPVNKIGVKLLLGGAHVILRTQHLPTNIGVKFLLGNAVSLKAHNLSNTIGAQ